MLFLFPKFGIIATMSINVRIYFKHFSPKLYKLFDINMKKKTRR